MPVSASLRPHRRCPRGADGAPDGAGTPAARCQARSARGRRLDWLVALGWLRRLRTGSAAARPNDRAAPGASSRSGDRLVWRSGAPGDHGYARLIAARGRMRGALVVACAASWTRGCAPEDRGCSWLEAGHSCGCSPWLRSSPSVVQPSSASPPSDPDRPDGMRRRRCRSSSRPSAASAARGRP